MKKKDEGKRMDVEHQKFVCRMTSSAEGGTGLFAHHHQNNGVERINADSEGGKEKMSSFWPHVRRREKNGRCIGNVIRMYKI